MHYLALFSIKNSCQKHCNYVALYNSSTGIPAERLKHCNAKRRRKSVRF